MTHSIKNLCMQAHLASLVAEHNQLSFSNSINARVIGMDHDRRPMLLLERGWRFIKG